MFRALIFGNWPFPEFKNILSVSSKQQWTSHIFWHVFSIWVWKKVVFISCGKMLTICTTIGLQDLLIFIICFFVPFIFLPFLVFFFACQRPRSRPYNIWCDKITGFNFLPGRRHGDQKTQKSNGFQWDLPTYQTIWTTHASLGTFGLHSWWIFHIELLQCWFRGGYPRKIHTLYIYICIYIYINGEFLEALSMYINVYVHAAMHPVFCLCSLWILLLILSV